MGRRLTGLLAFSWLLLATGCSLALDSTKTQCKKDTDCPSPFACGAQGLCLPASCSSDDACRARGAGWELAVCEQNECATAECEKSEQCEDGQGCMDGRCVAAQCLKDEDCKDVGPSAKCTNFACVDPTWGCLGQPDPREEADMSSSGTLRVKILYAFAQSGEMETAVRDLAVKVCAYPDQNCTNAFNVKWTYGDDHWLTVEGLENGFNYRIQFTARHPTKDLDLLPGEYLMYRTVYGETTDPKPMLMFEASVRDSISSQADVTVDPALGFMLARIFDCEEKELAGVAVSIDKNTTGCDGQCPTTIFYQNTSNLPDDGATATNSAGRAGVVNMVPDKFNRITLTRTSDDKKITSFVITPHAGWVTYTYFYPGDYGTAAD